MQQQIDALKEELNARLDNELGKGRKDVAKIKSKLTDRDREVEEKITEKLDEKMSDCSQLGVRELQEREDRKPNIIIINISP